MAESRTAIASAIGEGEAQLTQHGPSGEIIRKYINENAILRAYENTGELEISIQDGATGAFLYEKAIPQGSEPILLVDENIFMIRYLAGGGGDGLASDQLLVVEMMEPFRNETVSGIIKNHLEAYGKEFTE